MFDLQRIRGAGLEEAVRQAPAAVIIVEATSGGIVLANEEAKATMGRSLTGPGPSRLEDFRVLREAGDFELYRPDGDAYEPEEWPLMRSIRTGEEVSDEEYDYVAADGTRGTMRCDASPIYDDEGRVVAGVGIFRDVTVQKRTDEQLRDQAQLLENVHDAVVATDERYFVTTWNRGAERMYGWTAEEAVGRKIYEVLPPEHGDEQVATVLGELSETGRYRTEAIRHHKDGTPVHVDSLTIALRGEGGQTTGYVGIHRDITERKLADGRLRESSRRTENILESITDAFYAVDRDWRFTYANERALHLSHWAKEDEGLTREDLLGKNMWEVFPDAVSTLFYEKYKEAMREQKVVDLEEYYSPGDVWVEVHAYPFEGGWRSTGET